MPGVFCTKTLGMLCDDSKQQSMTINHLFPFAGLLILMSCHTDSSPPVPAAVTDKPVRNWKAETRALLDDWNRFHVPGKTDSLLFLYADSVFFYGQNDVPAQVCVDKTRDLLARWPDYRQQTDSAEWDLYALDSNRIICCFLKTVSTGGNIRQYAAYLNFDWNPDHNCYKISNEGDATTNENLEIRDVAAYQIYEQGDYDGDSIREKMWLVREKNTPEKQSWSSIRFSSPAIPVLPVESCIGGTPRNEGDLDGDGADEISLVPWWYQSRFTGFRVYTLKNGRWYHLIPGVYCSRFDLDDERAYRRMVEAGDTGFVWIREWEMDEETNEHYIRKKRRIALRPVPLPGKDHPWAN